MKCSCDLEYQCSKCRNCYACSHRYTYRRAQDQWWVRCPTGRNRSAYPDIDTQERVRIMREKEEATMGGEKNEPKTTDLTSNKDTQTPSTPAETAPATTETPANPDNL